MEPVEAIKFPNLLNNCSLFNLNRIKLLIILGTLIQRIMDRFFLF